MKTALVIEDNEDNSKLISFILEKPDYHTLLAATSIAGVSLVLREKSIVPANSASKILKSVEVRG